MKSKIIKRDEFIRTKWSGGDTTEFIIYPEGSELSKRNFEFRISSATFTSKSSHFSDYSGYERYLFPLNGSLSVSHKSLYKRELLPYELEYFLGHWNTDSTNTLDCIDFNFIVKENSYSKVEILNENSIFVPKRNGILCIYSVYDFSISIGSNDLVNVPGDSLFVIEEDDYMYNIKISSTKSPVIFCEFRN